MTDLDNSKRYIRAKRVRQRYGDISEMTLSRWVKSPKIGFPQPATQVGRFPLWDEAELDAYDRRCACRAGRAA
jgi:predicted DNA-binding transcriptional regulator AlpA